MLVDAILSRFRIKTKVLIFVLPFVVSISAVGFTGLYASGLLEGRMNLSNSVLQSLSGFKELAGSMHEFLQKPNDETHNRVLDYLKAQNEALEETLRGSGEKAEGKERLQEAIAGTGELEPLVGQLWTTHQDSEALLADLRKAQQTLIGLSLNVATQATAVEQRIQLEESEAKNMLRQAEFLIRNREMLSSIPRNFFSAKDMPGKVKVYADTVGKLKRIKGPLAQAIADPQSPAIKAMDDLIAAVDPLLQGEPTQDTISKLQAQFPQVNSLASEFFTTANRRTSAATKLFSTLDSKIVAANSALSDVRIRFAAACRSRVPQ